MYSPYRRWNDCLEVIGTVILIVIILIAPTVVALIILPVALLGILALIIRSGISAIPAVLMALGSLTTTFGVYVLMGNASDVARLIAASGMAMALFGYFLSDIGGRR